MEEGGFGASCGIFADRSKAAFHAGAPSERAETPGIMWKGFESCEAGSAWSLEQKDNSACIIPCQQVTPLMVGGIC